MRAIDSICFWSSAWNTTTSSIRFRNSGRKCVRTSCQTAPLIASCGSPLIAWMICEPRLEVITITVFLKSTVRPWPSVRRPSSSTCSSTLKTSGWAFSTSSSSTTLYGLRRTASVR
ncbi:hypothetical protein D9M72_434970 [compost metagenome]